MWSTEVGRAYGHQNVVREFDSRQQRFTVRAFFSIQRSSMMCSYSSRDATIVVRGDKSAPETTDEVGCSELQSVIRTVNQVVYCYDGGPIHSNQNPR